VARIVSTLGAERGINVINLVRRSDGVRQLAAAGIKNAIATEDEAWPAQAAALAGGAPIVAALDSVGGKSANQLMDLLAFGGTLLSFGALSGEPMLIDPGKLIFKQATVKGFWATKRSEQTSREDQRRMVGDLIRLGVAGRLPLEIAATFSLSEPGPAVVAAETPGRTGKVVLRGD
jgi:NADPH:quinone reductase-like Zn-dependent oxidoreductase